MDKQIDRTSTDIGETQKMILKLNKKITTIQGWSSDTLSFNGYLTNSNTYLLGCNLSILNVKLFFQRLNTLFLILSVLDLDCVLLKSKFQLYLHPLLPPDILILVHLQLHFEDYKTELFLNFLHQLLTKTSICIDSFTAA